MYQDKERGGFCPLFLHYILAKSPTGSYPHSPSKNHFLSALSKSLVFIHSALLFRPFTTSTFRYWPSSNIFPSSIRLPVALLYIICAVMVVTLFQNFLWRQRPPPLVACLFLSRKAKKGKAARSALALALPDLAGVICSASADAQLFFASESEHRRAKRTYRRYSRAQRGYRLFARRFILAPAAAQAPLQRREARRPARRE